MANNFRRDVKQNHPIESRVVTDAVHRFFKPKNETKSTDTEINPPDEETTSDSYFCKQCSLNINISPGNRDLKLHFENQKHDPYDNCVYCKKPVYTYVSNKGMEVYHTCKYD